MNKIYDVTMTISPSMAVYKNKESKKPIFNSASSISSGDSTNETNVTFNVHSGTHVDFPHHILNEGATSDEFGVDIFLRNVKVLDLTKVNEKITVKDLENFDIVANDFLLFKTKNSFSEEFDFKFVYLSVEAALYLVSKKISGVGIDALGIERDQSGHLTHKQLMAKNIWIIEGLRLKEVPAGAYFMNALPLKLENVDAWPLTVLLFTSDKR